MSWAFSLLVLTTTMVLSTAANSSKQKTSLKLSKDNKTRILVINHSLSGETNAVADAFVKGFHARLSERDANDTSLSVAKFSLQTEPPFQFPWSAWDFFDVMAETVVPSVNDVWKSRAIQSPPEELGDKRFDLVILGWQTWFLAPSLPVQLAVNSAEYRALLTPDVPVLMIGTHRNMWHRASRVLRKKLTELGSRVVGRVDFVQQSPFIQSIFNTVRWQLGGKKGKAGIETNAKELAYWYGVEYASECASGYLPAWYEAGEQHRYAVQAVEEIWWPVKRMFGLAMGQFRPGSFIRKLLTVIYGPLLILGIVSIGTPFIIVGTFFENLASKQTKRNHND